MLCCVIERTFKFIADLWKVNRLENNSLFPFELWMQLQTEEKSNLNGEIKRQEKKSQWWQMV